MKSSIKQRGDTLIEVMIALAIIGSVIAVAYATASRSLQVGRNAQERTEALKLAEGQIERLKARADSDKQKLASDASSIYAAAYRRADPSAASFCVTTTGVAAQEMIEQDMLGTPGDSLAFNPTPGGAPTGAQVYHNSCAVGIQNRYKLSIEREDSGEFSTFIVRVRWEKLGTGKDEVRISYRLHRGQA